MRTMHSLSALALLVGCSPAATFNVPTEGIDLELPGGAALRIPAGAVDEDVQITATLITDLAESGYASAPGYTDGLPFAIALEPHGLQFNQPATLTLPDAGAVQWPVVLRTDDESDDSWESAGLVESGDGEASILIDGFSGYALSSVQNGACPCWDGVHVERFFREMRGRGWPGRFQDSGWGILVKYADPASGDAVVIQTINNGCSAATTPQEPGTDPAALHADLFGAEPDRLATQGYAVTAYSGISGQEFGACQTLLRAGFSGGLGTRLDLSVSGLSGSQSLRLGSGSELWSANDGDANTLLLPRGAELSLSFAEVPSGLGCSFADPGPGIVLSANDSLATMTPGTEVLELAVACVSDVVPETCNGLDDDGDGDIDEDFDADGDGVTTCGVDGVAGNADDDCDDADLEVNPELDEVCFDGKDNDCDGGSVADETADTDGDGVPNACDANPNSTCGAFTLAQVESMRAEPGAQCYVDATGAAMPALLQTEAEAFTGVFIQWTPEAYEMAGVGPTGAEWFAAYGCASDPTTYCQDNSRPLLGADSLVLEAEHDACKDVAAYACR